MKYLVRILLVVIFMFACLWSIGNSIDSLPFHFSDFLLSLFAFGGVIYWAEFDTKYIFEFIEWLKTRNK